MTYTVENYKKALNKAKKSHDALSYEAAMQYANQLEKGLINMGRGAAVKEIKEQFKLQ
jgi:hypothetical protein